MTRSLTMLLVLAVGPFVFGQDDSPNKPRQIELPPFERVSEPIKGVAGRESRVIVTGDGRSALAIYVYDALGHCVAFDDAPGQVFDDRIASWMPAYSGIFEFEIRNAGPTFSPVEMAAR